MFYLKCENCGFLNEVKSEYLVFCTGCDKKLTNNFRNWRSRNFEEKSFDDFKKAVCISEEDISIETESKKKLGKKGFKYWIALAVAFALFSFIGHFAGVRISNIFSSEKTDKEILEQNWVKESYGNYGLTVETPVKMGKGKIEVPDNSKEVIDEMSLYNYNTARGFKVIINSIKYNPSIGVANLQGGADGAINGIKAMPGVTDFNYSEKPITNSNISGIEQNGTFKINGVDGEFINSIFTEGLVAWQVMVIYQFDDEVGRKAARRVIESIEIKK